MAYFTFESPIKCTWFSIYRGEGGWSPAPYYIRLVKLYSIQEFTNNSRVFIAIARKFTIFKKFKKLEQSYLLTSKPLKIIENKTTKKTSGQARKILVIMAVPILALIN